ncbi:MAG TPA: ABC transporter permease subunit [Caldilineae bacterium]|nr:ABC transporter permease subunit [Caldilineae bacterium]
MRNALIIARRELGAYFASPIAYVITAAYLVVMGILFSLIVAGQPGAEASLRFVFGNVFSAIILIIIGPLLTMRLLAEEQRSGTIELLLTAPVRDWEVVVGKYLAGYFVFLAMLVPTLVYPLLIERFGDPDHGVFISTYIGLALLGMALLALGLLTSAMTQNQIVAAFLGLGLILVLTFLQFLATIVSGPLAGVLSYLGLFNHFFDFLRGVIDTRDVVYYLSVTAGALFLTTQVLGARRWR